MAHFLAKKTLLAVIAAAFRWYPIIRSVYRSFRRPNLRVHLPSVGDLPVETALEEREQTATDTSGGLMKRINMSQRHLAAFLNIDKTLLDVFWDLLRIWPIDEIYIVSIDRTKKEDNDLGGSGVHADGPPWRAIDVRITTLPDYQLLADKLCENLNSRWVYDPGRPTMPVAYCRLHGTGPHIHLQVHPNTDVRA